MYIDSMHIEGFGIFSDEHIDIPSPGLTIIEGLNEAGKTTLLAFVRGILFGFEDPRSNKNRYLPLQGRRYGGRIVVTLTNGEKYDIERIGERGRGQVTIRLPDGTREGQEVLDHILAGATRDLYRNIFGFGLEELQQLGTLHDEAVSMRIYSAGTGTGSMSLLQADNRLQDEMGKLFRERSSTKKINMLFSDLDNVHAKLRDLRNQTDQYDNLLQTLDQLTLEIGQLEIKRKDIRQKLDRTENLLKAWDSWVKFQSIDKQLSELPEIPEFPADGVKRLDLLNGTLDNLREQHMQEKKAAEEADAECNSLVIDQMLLGNQEQIQRLTEEMAKFDTANNDLPSVKADCKNKEASLQEALAQLGSEWGEERLSVFNASIPEREIIRHFEEQLRGAQDNQRDATKTYKQAEEVVRKANSDFKEAEEDFQIFPEPPEKDWLTFEAKDIAVRKLRTLKEQLNKAQYDLENAILIHEQDEGIVKKTDRERKEAEEEFQKIPEPFEKDWSAFEVKNAAIRRLKTIFSRVKQLETEKQHINERKEELEFQKNSVKEEISREVFSLPLWCAVLLLLLGFILIFWFGKEKKIELAVISGFLFFLLTGLYLWFRVRLSQDAQNRRFSMENECRRLSDKLQNLDLGCDKNKKEYTECQERMHTELDALDKDGIEREDALEEVSAEVEQDKEHLRKWEGLKAKEEEAKRRFQDAAEALEDAKNREGNCRQHLEQVKATFLSELAKLGKTDINIEDALEEVSAEVERNKEHLRKWEGLKTKEEEARRRFQDATEELKSAKEKEENCKQLLQEKEEEWRIWLESRQLKAGLSPDGVLEVFSTIGKAREKLELVHSLRQRVEAMESYIKGFQDRAYTILTDCGMALSDLTKLNEALDKLARDLAQANSNSITMKELTRKVKEHRGKLELLEKNLTEKGNEKKQLIEVGSAKDEEDFRTRAKVYEMRQELSKEMSQLRISLEQIGGTGEPWTEFEEALKASSPEELSSDKYEIERELSQIEENLKENQEKKGALNKQIHDLEASEEISELLLKEKSLQAEFERLAGEWAFRAICRTLLQRARQRYERDRQPQVIKEAEGFFKKITCGRYQRVFSPIGEQRIELEAVDSSRKEIGVLSRGTAEQLYLSLRFGLVREFGRHAEHLPVIMDDILVNFDPERAPAAAQTILDLAESCQILFFTCHPETTRLFREISVTIPCLSIMDGTIHSQTNK